MEFDQNLTRLRKAIHKRFQIEFLLTVWFFSLWDSIIYKWVETVTPSAMIYQYFLMNKQWMKNLIFAALLNLLRS